MGIDIGEWLDMMADTIDVNAFTSRSVSGKPSYDMGTTKTYPCYIRMSNHKIVNAHGQEVIARGYVIVGTTDVIGINDLITLPADYVPRTPPILDVNLTPDENGTHHVTLHNG